MGFTSQKRYSFVNPLKKKFLPQFFRSIPRSPGVYFMLDEHHRILYIGKAKDLRERISSYSHARLDVAADHTLDLLERAVSIYWDVLASDQEAILREAELLHAIRPPFNIAQTEPAHYSFIGIKNSAPQQESLDFFLSQSDRIQGEGFEVFGCFCHPKWIRQGFLGLLRLLHAAHSRVNPFCYPTVIDRSEPPLWSYTSPFPQLWKPELTALLRGESNTLLHCLMDSILENDALPPEMRPFIQKDINAMQIFYRLGPLHTQRLIQLRGIIEYPILSSQMDDLIQQDLRRRLHAMGLKIGFHSTQHDPKNKKHA